MVIEVRENFEIKNLTTFKIGGKIDKLYLPKNQSEFVQLLTELDDYLVLGNCSNVLISSNGYRGNLILTTQMKEYFINGNFVAASISFPSCQIYKISGTAANGITWAILTPIN